MLASVLSASLWSRLGFASTVLIKSEPQPEGSGYIKPKDRKRSQVMPSLEKQIR
ncbi:hypothetical protein SCJ08_02480 [Legionella pneumophila serogroup 1]